MLIDTVVDRHDPRLFHRPHEDEKSAEIADVRDRELRLASTCENAWMTQTPWPHDVVETAEGDRLCVWRPTAAGQPARLHFAHATGFHAHTYAPLFALLPDIPVAAWDMRGHGASAPAGKLAGFNSWRDYARDLGTWLKQQEQPVWLAGHSVGATVSAQVAAEYPHQVRGLILIEPVFMSRQMGWLMRLGRLSGRQGAHKLVRGALRRRNGFASLDEAYQAYRGRGAFRTWSQAWLRAYVEYAFRDEAGTWMLRCEPAWESRSFALTPASPWAAVRKLSVPTHVWLGADAHSTTNLAARRSLRRLCSHARLQVWPDASHFLPMEHTEDLALRIRQLVQASPD